MAQKPKQFKGSRIVAKKFPKRKPGAGMRKTESGKLYSFEMKKIRSALNNRGIDAKKAADVTAFCRNYYVEYSELPPRAALKKLFPFLKDLEPPL